MITIKELQKKGIELSREEIAIRAIEISKMCANGSYKNAVSCIGRMVALSKTINDGYWREKFNLGASYESYYLLSNLKEGHPDKNTKVN